MEGKRRCIATAIQFLLVSLAVYIGAYYWLARPNIFLFATGKVIVVPQYGGRPVGSWLDSVFLPIHVVDRLIRPGMWTPPY
jgi:hypothetical protein